MNITNQYEVMIFRNEEYGKVKYNVGLSNKLKDGTYDNASYPIQFNQGVELQDRTKIKINNAFLSFYKWEYQGKKGTTFFIKCTDFTVNGQVNDFEINNSDIENVFGEISDEDFNSQLPF